MDVPDRHSDVGRCSLLIERYIELECNYSRIFQQAQDVQFDATLDFCSDMEIPCLGMIFKQWTGQPHPL